MAAQPNEKAVVASQAGQAPAVCRVLSRWSQRSLASSESLPPVTAVEASQNSGVNEQATIVDTILVSCVFGCGLSRCGVAESLRSRARSTQTAPPPISCESTSSLYVAFYHGRPATAPGRGHPGPSCWPPAEAAPARAVMAEAIGCDSAAIHLRFLIQAALEVAGHPG